MADSVQEMELARSEMSLLGNYFYELSLGDEFFANGSKKCSVDSTCRAIFFRHPVRERRREFQ
jgi:hypothetical protein